MGTAHETFKVTTTTKLDGFEQFALRYAALEAALLTDDDCFAQDLLEQSVLKEQIDLLTAIQATFDPEQLRRKDYFETASLAAHAMSRALERSCALDSRTYGTAYAVKMLLVETVGVLGNVAEEALPTLVPLLDARFPGRATTTLAALAKIKANATPTALQKHTYREIVAAAAAIANNPRANYQLRDTAALVALLFAH